MSATPSPDRRPIFFFDIDNCLYSRSLRIQELMQELIDSYFVRHLALPASDARALHSRYYKDYGLAISGLVKHHTIDPLAYNREVDDALPLDDVIKPDLQLRKLLGDMDKSKVKMWLFTNAHITHAQRVVRLLGVEDCFEGITYCDYAAKVLLAKPHEEMFEKAERDAKATSKDNCYFVDDSALNCRHAKERGWTVVHKLEEEDTPPESKAGKYEVRDLEELRSIFPQFFIKHLQSAVNQRDASSL